MAVASGRPDKFVGLHFFNPVQLMKLVEVINTIHTDKDVYDTVTQFGQKIGKTTVSCGDTPGFIVNRLLIPYLSSAMEMVDRKDASVKDIDISMQLGAGHPMGPLHLADYVGMYIYITNITNIYVYAYIYNVHYSIWYCYYICDYVYIWLYRIGYDI